MRGPWAEGDQLFLPGSTDLAYSRKNPHAPKGKPMSTATEALKKVKASMMNAIHDLPLLVARDEGYFRDQGLDVDVIRTPGSGQRDSDHRALRTNVFDRTMEALYDQGECDQFRMCEWGVMKRAVESNVTSGHRPA